MSRREPNRDARRPAPGIAPPAVPRIGAGARAGRLLAPLLAPLLGRRRGQRLRAPALLGAAALLASLVPARGQSVSPAAQAAATAPTAGFPGASPAAYAPLAAASSATAPVEPVVDPSGVIQAFGAAGPNDPVGPGDLLEVRVFDQPQLSGAARVGQDGDVDLPFLGAVSVAARTPLEIERQLTTSYARLLRHPLVSVRVLQVVSRSVAITGEVVRPGVYAFSGALRLSQALAMAGGVESDRAGAVLYLLHANLAPPQPAAAGKPVTFRVQDALSTINLRRLYTDPNFDPLLHPGDSIEVPPAREIYVTGDVTRSGAIALRQGLTLSQAVSMAGGPMAQADPHHVRVVRQRPGDSRPQVLIFDLARIHHGQAPDVPLEADDICYVPESGFRDVGLGILDFFAGAGRWRLQSAAGVY